MRCLDAKMRRGEVGYGNKNILSLGRESGCLNGVNYNHERGLNHELGNILDCHANARNDVKCHTEDNSPKYRMFCNDVGLKSQTYRSFKFWYRDFCSSLRANAKQSRETLITRSDKRRSNLIQNEKDEIATFRCTPLAMTCDLFPRPFGERVRERGYLATSLLSRLAAFTLAEVLVTLGIIGVVSAMTVPTLMQNYQRQSYVTQLHKVYNELNQATLRYQTDRNALNLKEAGLTSQAAAENFIESNFKIVQKCGSNKTPCFASSYKKIAGTSSIGWYTPRTNYIIASGTAIGVSYRPVGDVLLELYVDTNGAKGPNIAGRDIFAMFVYNNGIIDDFNFSENTTAPMTEAARNTNYTNVCAADTTNWHGCLGKVINDNWQMTY